MTSCGAFKKNSRQRSLRCGRPDEVRSRQPSVSDEIKMGLDYYEVSIFATLPTLYTEVAGALLQASMTWPSILRRCPLLLHFGSWIGGDRDGNPFVTPSVTIASHSRRAASLAGAVSGRLLAGSSACSLSSSQQGLCQPGTPHTAWQLPSMRFDRQRLARENSPAILSLSTIAALPPASARPPRQHTRRVGRRAPAAWKLPLDRATCLRRSA